MSNAFVDLASPGIATLKPYVPGKPVSELERELGITDSIKLASNENPLGPSPTVMGVLPTLAADICRYPDGGGYDLSNALSEKHDIDPACITLGNGSNDVLDMVARVFLTQGKESVFSEHAFAVYPLSSLAVGATLKMVSAKNYGHDLDAMLAAITEATGVVWIANPNNPTGTWLKRDELYNFIKAVPSKVIVVLDEAYIEYVHEEDYPDGSQWLSEFPNLIVTRTFSKAYGLAALRVGYALSHPDVADLLNRVRQPFNVNSYAQAVATAALGDQEYIKDSVQLNDEGMAQITEGLDELGLSYIPSVGNFIAVDFARPAEEADMALLKQGIITRPIANYGLPTFLRVSIGSWDENRRFLLAASKL